ncbi:MAG: hypothetical protein LUD00_12130 [Prevotellaceae bacterium]|nr:hypothetical protein [Prevotellaceae bacterium]
MQQFPRIYLGECVQQTPHVLCWMLCGCIRQTPPSLRATSPNLGEEPSFRIGCQCYTSAS